MPAAKNESQALGDLAARQLANATKTVPQLSTITPRWLLHLLNWVPVEAGIYRVNRVINPDKVAIHSEEQGEGEAPLPQTYVDYETNPREYTLRTISTLLDINTRVSDLYSSPHDQIAQQLRLTIESIKERQESELINNAEYGLLAQAVSRSLWAWQRSAVRPPAAACRPWSSACSAPSSSPGAASPSSRRTRFP